MTYRILTTERGGQWVARAEREDSGDRFGIECAGVTADEAAARLKRWLVWQGEHAAAFAALQQAERAYHRTIAGSAFARSREGSAAGDLAKDILDALESARVRLDEIRARRPA